MNSQNLNPYRFAAIVYDNGVKVDGLMSGFARELVEAGVDARGIVQLPPDADGCGPGALMKLRDVATGEVLPLCQDLGPGAGSCCLDTSALASAAHRLRAAAREPSDILFFSKFGKQEAAGRRHARRARLRDQRRPHRADGGQALAPARLAASPAARARCSNIATGSYATGGWIFHPLALVPLESQSRQTRPHSGC